MKIYLLLFMLTVMFSGCFNAEFKELRHFEVENPLPECPDSPNCYRGTFEFQNEFQEVVSAAHTALENMDTHEKSDLSDSLNTEISAVFKIPVFGWLDDVAIRIEESETSAIVHLRSASREGYWDIGVNKRRVKKIIKKIHNELNSN